MPDESSDPFGLIIAMDQPASSFVTQAALDWTPRRPGLLYGLEHLHP